MTIEKTLETAKDVVRRYCSTAYPDATLVLLCGSWVRNEANDDSDIDVVIFDPGKTGYYFACVEFESWLIEVCVMSPTQLEDCLRYATKDRHAEIAHMFVDGIVIRGAEQIAREVKDVAIHVIDGGPAPLGEAERLEMRRDLTVLLRDLKHATVAEIPALAAQCHTALAKAAIDTAGGWQGEEKTLRRALVKVAPEAAARLDDGLRRACQDDSDCLLEIGDEIVAALGGELRTYIEKH